MRSLSTAQLGHVAPVRRAMAIGIILPMVAAAACDRAPASARTAPPPDGDKRIYHRVVSIAPDATELIAAIGRADRLVGVSTFCIYPPAVERLPRVGGLFDVNLELLLRLSPDLIVLRGENRAVQALCERNHIRIYRDRTNTFDDIFRTLAELGDLLDARDEADRAAAAMRHRLGQIERAVAGRPRPRVFVALARNPDTLAAVMTAGQGTFIDEVIRRAGGQNVFAAASIDYPQVSPESVLAAQPEVIIESMPEVAVTDALREKVRRAWQGLGRFPAADAGRIHILDAPNSQIPSHRIVDVVADVARLLHPETELD
jgi:iron complex transport system substrate-binding protein